MSEVYAFSETQVLFFAMVLARVSAFVVSWPVFGVENVSQKLKILFAVALSLAVFPTLRMDLGQARALGENLILLAAREAAIGVSMGFVARLFFHCFRMAGELIGQAMGLSSAQTFNPMLGGQTSATEQFYVALATLFYLGLNGHHHLLTGLVRSFEWVPAARLGLSVAHFPGLVPMSREIIELGLKFSAPVVVSILVVNLVLGVVGKTVPQINVLVTSFPVNVLAALFLMSVTLPMLLEGMGAYLAFSTARVFRFVGAF